MFEYIIHISDIHIRLSSRFEEYQIVFDQFRENIQNINNAIIVCTGDLFHQKNELTPDCILLTIKFLQDISQKHKVVIIPGNHDFLMNNFHKCDSITSILKDRNLPNVDYLLESGIYTFDNIIFVHNSLWNPNNTEWIDATTISKKKSQTIISLFHGQVSGCKTQLGFTLRDTISINVFDGSDMVLLGDIHKHQFLQPHIAYAGSMISQNFGETDEEHGYILWDISKRTGTFHKIMNNYSYRQIDIFVDKIVYLEKIYDDIKKIVKLMPSHVRLQILIYDLPDYDCDKLRKRFLPIQPRIRHITQSLSFLNNTPNNTSSHNDMEKHVCDYLILNNFTNPLYLERLRDNLKFNKSLTSSSSTWNILELSFDHLFGYGMDNKIIFDGRGIIGIFGSNSIGKSTIIDIIIFMLYGRITRYASGNSTPKELIHEKQKSFQATIKIQISGVVYTIHKKGTRDKHNKIKIEEEMFKDTGENLTEEQRGKTDKVIRDLIGSVEQFLSLSMCLQVPEKSFRQMTQKEKKEFIYSLFRLNSFEEYKLVLSDESKNIQSKLTNISQQLNSFEEDSEDVFQKRIDDFNNEYTQIKTSLIQIEKERNDLDEKWTKYTSLTTRKKQLDRNIEDLRIRCNFLEKEISKIKGDASNEDITILQSKFEKNKNNVLKIKNKIDKLYLQKKKIPIPPSTEDFSYSRYLKLKKKEMSNRYTTNNSYHLNPSIHFSYFDKKNLMNHRKEMENFEKNFFKKIDRYFREIDLVDSEYTKICTVENTIQDEYIIHQDVKYNKSCQQCMCNPFRERKESLENRIDEMRNQKHDINEKKKKYQQKIINIFKTVDISCETQQEFYNIWKTKKQTITNSITDIEMFEKMMNTFLKKSLNQMWNNDCNECERSNIFIENLGKFLCIRLNNHLVDKKIKEKEDERNILEHELDKDQKYLIHLLEMEKKNRLSMELKNKRDEYKKKQDELLHINEELKTFVNVQELKTLTDKEWIELTKKECRMSESIDLKKKQFQEWKLLIKKKTKLSKEISITKDLIRITDRNGFPSYILKMLIPDLNQYMNNILMNFTDRQIKFDLNEDGEVLFHTQSESSDLMIQFYGGMESLMIDLATKITFSHFAYCPMSSIFILDEGISVLDESHIQNIEILFDFLKQHYSHILLISHLPDMKNVVDKNVIITKINGYSKINCNV